MGKTLGFSAVRAKFTITEQRKSWNVLEYFFHKFEE